MNLADFENKISNQEQVIQAEARGESEATFALYEAQKIKNKLEKRKKQQQKFAVIFGSLTLIIVVLIVVVIYSQYRLRTLSKEEVEVPQKLVITASTTPAEIIATLKRHILLPEGNPQIAEVKDVEKLKEQQAFFKDAENGDIIVLYETMIYLYRPSLDIIIASGDVSGLGQAKP
jgi:hypothetical protein